MDVRRFNYRPEIHTDPGCQWPRCGGASDGAWDGVPYCVEHAELVFQRLAAASISPEAAAMLPTFDDF